ncbi:MAG: putative DNA binding domain-containing protein [Candidatus Aminicenantes bacterium]|nr:putative DNA binding domain-containing protein [Candidatus Aminicenantes bacterium]
MDSKELEHIIAEGENYLVEFKEQVNKTLSRELTAFANASGGRIFLGVDDGGVIKGIENTNRLHSQIQDIAFNCQPPITIDISSSQNIIIISVSEGKDKPYQCSEGYFVRMGANSQKMSRDQLVAFLQAEGKLRFEEQFHSRFDFKKHFNPERLNAFLRLAGIRKELDDETILENLGAAERLNGQLKMKNVGVLFFAKTIELLCEQATITCGTFEGTDRFQVVNRKDYQEDIISNITMAMHFIKQELKVR